MLAANGLRFHVRDEGTGTPVILLHGFPDTSDLWRHQVPALVQCGFRAIAPDLRGRGRSDKPEGVSAYRLSTIVQDVTGMLDALGIDRAHVVGHDWGAAVAWLCAMLAPERVDRLVAISVGAPGTGAKPTYEDLQKGWYRLVFLFEGISEELIQRDDWYLFRLFLQGARDTDAYVRTLSEPGALTPALNWYRANLPVRNLLGRSEGPRLPKARARTLGIWSTGDLYLTEDAMLRSAERVEGDWRYERLEGSHWIPIDQPDRLNALLLDFLRG
ncbi:MAG TPA: alpha/beta hydrolase [Candidatus Limnocylindrales bacterium]|nr:alpha/beta hydrolase [Candidatus Limnocylindrales bacterium]